MKKFFLAVLLLVAMLSPTTAAATTKPSDILDLQNWYLTLPTKEVSTPDTIGNNSGSLIGYEKRPYFYAEGNGVVFNTPVGGAHTKNSKYPRTELREKINGKLASWSTKSGIHTMEVEGSINFIPVKKPELVVAQIHGKSDDLVLIHLSGKKLTARWNDGKKYAVLDANYTLGTPFNVKLVAMKGMVQVFYNGTMQATFKANQSGCYFKTGNYLQSNPSKGDSPSLMGQVVLRKVVVKHTN